jgi:hypothetical protein
LFADSVGLCFRRYNVSLVGDWSRKIAECD